MINDREDWTEMEHEKADIKKRMQYILNMRPVFNKEALFSDGTEYYRIPAEPKAGDTVTIKFRTQRNNVDSGSMGMSECMNLDTVYACQSSKFF